MPDADLILEGGGMKGIGLVGAVLRLMRAGYRFQRLGGTSAGAIVAAFVAAGADERKLAEIMGRLDYARVRDRTAPRIPVISEGTSLLRTAGFYEGDYIHRFLEDELERLGKTTFGQLKQADGGADSELPRHHRYKLVVMATDITRGRLLRLPWDYGELGKDPDSERIADAVRASISIPFYFKPVVERNEATGEETTLVDGGVLSNFPIAIFDRTDRRKPRWPTLGVKVIPQLPASTAELFPGMPRVLNSLPPVQLLEQTLATAIVGHDQTYVSRPCVERRTIPVDTSAVGIVEFDASEAQREALRASGESAAEEFLDGWSWRAWKRDCRRWTPRWRRPLAGRASGNGARGG